MYLKSIEVHGFKSFANKIVFDFHNGITGIVGPNGSGKSNVGDAVRWVLGEQSAKQLRGASMQDVIFAGTENRKPVSYAFVSITLDNADHVLPVDYEEVTVARRVYRSGESEYLINGSSCRLKDVAELFYDTGIGKEGYSIIGQGQIERILSGKPEERRELFDEAAGIVKFKRRKAMTQKKLERERENLVRINDILSELERQVGPLEKQAEKAKVYLKKKEELKRYEVNLFLLDLSQNEIQQKELEEKNKIAKEQLEDTEQKLGQIRAEYAGMEQELEQLERQITDTREEISTTTLQRGKMEGQINVLLEQIHTAEMSKEHFKNRRDAVLRDIEERQKDKAEYDSQKEGFARQLQELVENRKQAEQRWKELQHKISSYNDVIEKGKNEIIELLNHMASIKGKQQRYDTMLEQLNIRRAQLNQRKLRRKSEEADLDNALGKYQQELAAIEEKIQGLENKDQQLLEQEREWKQKLQQARAQLEQSTAEYHKAESRLESLKNIAERYDGYGNSIRKVMEKKKDEPGIHGVVADLIKVEKKYETAIETALGGSIQHIVTSEENTAKRMVAYLKKNRFGRATFLPLSSVTGRNQNRNEKALSQPGVIGWANDLVNADKQYDGVLLYLLGRILVVDEIDHATALAREFHYSLNIVTLEGEHLSPGGSISGGAFRNSSNLLGRKREIDDLSVRVEELKQMRENLQKRMREIQTAQELLQEDKQANETEKQAAVLEQNTARMNVDRVKEQMAESEKAEKALAAEGEELYKQQKEIEVGKSEITAEIDEITAKEKQIEEQTAISQTELELETEQEQKCREQLDSLRMEESSFSQKEDFIRENRNRVIGELKKLEEELQQIDQDADGAQQDVGQKQEEIAAMRESMNSSKGRVAELEQWLKEKIQKKEELSGRQKGFFQKREELSEQKNILDKELYRLNDRQEKLENDREEQTDYMWAEYELTPHSASELRDEQFQNIPQMKSMITETKGEIRRLGDVNVNAIEEYKEIAERYEFLKGQHDDLIEAEKTLMGIIEELDIGMRNQFAEKFAEIQREFDKAFKDLFGGGKGTLELVEDEDILESGIRITAHPPGKKLQNMMQLSGGEKSLTAIALLFAIQNLKPSPFCLLDEIEAALDDSNVNRFANYLKKLTKNTQFIVITHRRGTMAAADRLYGITMQEKGISTLVSVSLIENELDE